MPIEAEPEVESFDTARLAELLPRLADEVKALVSAEVAVYRAELDWRVRAAGWAGIMFGVAFGMATAAAIALVVGIEVWLAPNIGGGWAVVTTVGGALALAGIFGWLGKRQIKAIRRGDKRVKS